MVHEQSSYRTRMHYRTLSQISTALFPRLAAEEKNSAKKYTRFTRRIDHICRDDILAQRTRTLFLRRIRPSIAITNSQCGQAHVWHGQNIHPCRLGAFHANQSSLFVSWTAAKSILHGPIARLLHARPTFACSGRQEIFIGGLPL